MSPTNNKQFIICFKKLSCSGVYGHHDDSQLTGIAIPDDKHRIGSQMSLPDTRLDDPMAGNERIFNLLSVRRDKCMSLRTDLVNSEN